MYNLARSLTTGKASLPISSLFDKVVVVHPYRQKKSSA